MGQLERSYWLAVATIAYVGVASAQSTQLGSSELLVLLLAPLFLLMLWRHTSKTPSSGVCEPSVSQAFRVAGLGAAVWVIARLGAPQQAALELAAVLGAAACAVAGIFGLSRIAPMPGLVKAPRASRSVDAAAFAALLWGVTIVVAATRFFSPDTSLRLDPLTLDYTNTAASIGSMMVLAVASLRVRVMRRLELGVGDRAAGALALSLTALAVAIPTAAINIAPPDRVLPLAMIVASLSSLWTVLVPNPAKVAIVMRGTIAVMLLGVPTMLIVGILVKQAQEHAATVSLFGSIAAIGVGLLSRAAARPLGPEQSRWLRAIDRAREQALVPEPRTAIAQALDALKATSSSPQARPELWRLEPPGTLSVDVAGYLHERDADVPAQIVELASREPERTLRIETLASLEVRQSETRPLLEWFRVRNAFSATLVVDGDGPSGFLLLPRGDRSAYMTLEEANAVRSLADRISSLLSVTAAMTRARKRAQQATEKARHFRVEYERLRAVLSGQAARHRGFAANLARPLTIASYSAAARLALAKLRQLAKRRPLIALRAPIGVSTHAWAARAHLDGDNNAGPFMIVEAASETPAHEARWSTHESPLALAQGGTLYIADAHLLSQTLQQKLLETLTQTASSSEEQLAPANLILGVREPVSRLLDTGVLNLAWRPMLENAEFSLPMLCERAEDLRALILDAVSRACRNPRSPLGVDRSTLQALMDYSWPGNDGELYDVLGRAAALAAGPVLTLEDLRQAGFNFEASAEFQPNSLLPASPAEHSRHHEQGIQTGHEHTPLSGDKGSQDLPADEPTASLTSPSTHPVRRRRRAPRNPRRRR